MVGHAVGVQGVGELFGVRGSTPEVRKHPQHNPPHPGL